MVNTGPTPVTVIGLGAMGQALATAFLDAGHPTTVWNRTAAKADPLVAKGAVRAETVAEAVAAAPLIVVCVLDYAAVHALLGPAADELPGRVLVNLTNGTAQEARASAQWAAELGAEYVDGGIMAIPPTIGTPDSVILYSGSQQAFDTHSKALDLLGTSKFLGTDAALASLHDLALLGAMYGMFAGAYNAIAMVGTEKVAATEFTDELLVPWLNSMVAVLPMLAEEVDSGAEVSEGRRLVERVALTNIIDTAKAQGVAANFVNPLQAIKDNT
ncbi:NAD binding domain of 6-phosphogluconate dehydrogenase [Saccharopolyspora kobensis]|uniref:NAD binding domain of 6-phosphogluconate dehydrogenase n=1 Tax=Saccharopolyspora kobensis TaxID=146035 RepID=A0A1H5SXP6_9PSEU|nr:NAD(P)-binding domain-containing protein [Saccharopolyspora kobensis]SEF55275.1 NAD binding domain of 6-phosphogluconate dehydrogenase [Saccharopolyspora kobensis]SFC52652.1 NAD binding domain of 6-phosphogluconate dehydrogenase [Saccharopolyspora kobensis]